MRCAKFDVAVFKVSMLNWGVNLPWVYIHGSIYIYRSAEFAVAVIKASMLN